MYKKYVSIMIVIAIIGGLFYILNAYTPLFADDYSYMYSFYNGERIASVCDIIKSQYQHYIIMNGRFVTHFLAQLFLLLGKDIFNIINSFCFLALGLLICFHGFGTFKNIKCGFLLLIYCLIIITCPSFGQSYLWVCGASNYLYGISIILMYLIPYRISIDKDICDKNIFKKSLFSILMCLFGIIAGATNENNGVALIAIVVLYILLYGVNLWKLAGLSGNIVGLLLMLLAPGQNVRLNNAGGISLISIFKRFFYYTFDFFENFGLLFLLLTAILSIIYIYNKNELLGYKQILNKYRLSIIYFIGLLSSIYSMIVPPSFPDRVWNGPLCFFLILLLSVIHDSKIMYKLLNKKIILNLFMVLISVIALSEYVNGYFEIKKLYIEHNLREQYILNELKEGKEEIHIPSLESKSRFACYDIYGDLSFKDEWPNTDIARYYGVNTIVRDDSIDLFEK